MRKTGEKVVSLLLALTFIFSGVSVFSANAAGYNPDAAIAYAKSHWNDGVGVCDQFVKACLSAGGVTITAGGVANVKNALVNGGYGTLYKLTPSGNLYKFSDNSGKVSKGDPLFFVCTTCGGVSSSSAWPHVALCGEGTGGYLTDYAHNSAHDGSSHKLWKDLGNSSHPGHTMEVYAFHMNTSSTPTDTTPPTQAIISVNKTSAATNEALTFSFTTDGNINDLWIYKPDGNSEAFCDVGTSYSLSFSTAGNYQALVQTWNDSGACSSERISFYVYELPEKPVFSSVKNNGDGTVTLKWKECANTDRYSVRFFRAGENEEYIFLFNVTEETEFTYELPNGDYTTFITAQSYYGWTNGDMSDIFSITRNNHTIAFDPNGGSNPPANQTGNGATTLSSAIPVREGFTFLGWASSASAAAAQYRPGETFDLTEDTTLYAVWAEDVQAEIVLKEDSGAYLDEDNGIIFGVEANLSEAQLIDRFIGVQGGNIEVSASSRRMGTGTVITLCDASGNELKSYCLVVFGDIDGNGIINSSDIVAANEGLAYGFEQDCFKTAANVSMTRRNDRFNATDVAALLEMFQNTGVDQTEIADTLAYYSGLV